MKNYGKKVLSVLLAALMCLTVVALDFSSLTAEAYVASPTHTFKLQIYQTGKDGGYDGQDGGGRVYVYGKNQNGTGSQATIANGSSVGTGWATKDGGTTGLGEWTTEYWPTSVTVGCNICNNNSMFYKSQSVWGMIQIAVKDGATGQYGSWQNVGEIRLDSNTKSGGGGSAYKQASASVPSGLYPYAAKVATSASEGNNATTTLNYTLNATGGANKTASLAAYVYDQYNVQYNNQPSSWSVSGTVGGDCSLAGTGARESNTLTMSATKYTRAKAAATVTATYGSLHHYWTVNITPTYKITYNIAGNGGTSTVPGPDTTTNTSTGSANVTYTIPSGTNYTAKKEKGSASTGTWTVVGWNGSQSATTGTAAGRSITIDSYNDTLYAIFSKTATATFYWYKSDGTRTSSTNTKTVYNNATQYTFDVPKSSVPTTFTVNGTTYTFAGWAVDSTTKTTTDHAASVTTAARNIKNGNLTDTYSFYALYTGSVTLSYDNNGGSGQPESKTSNLVLNCGANTSAANNTSGRATFTLNPDNVRMSRYYSSDFVGWKTAKTDSNGVDSENANYKDGTVTWAASSGLPTTITIAKNTTVYATYYDYRYNIKFYDYKGDVVNTQTVRHNFSAEAPAMHTDSSDPSHRDANSHYVFDHWEYTDGSLYNLNDKLTKLVNGYTYEVWGKYVGHKHIWGDPFQIEGAVTCTSGQTFKKECTVCGFIRDFESDPLGHDYVLTGVAEPTCTKAGSYGKLVCRNCGAIDPNQTAMIDGVETPITDENRRIEPLGHLFGIEALDKDEHDNYILLDDNGDYIVAPQVVEATCTTPGYYFYECERCGEILRVGNIPAAGHAWTTVEEIPATCTEGGHTGYTKCTNCGLFLEGEDEDTEALGHDYVLVEETDSTCTVKGHYAYYECSRCGEYFDLVDGEYVAIEDITAKDKALLDHDYQPSEENIPVTCTVDGHNGAWVCTMCGAVDPDHPGEVIPAPGHDLPADWTVFTPATCAAPGEKRKQCSRCEYYESEEIPALAHVQGEYVAAVPATCTENGYTEGYKCANCDGYYLAPVATDPLGHTMETIPGEAPTCTEDGIPDCYKCTRCEKLFLDEAGKNEISGEVGIIPRLGHNFTDWVTAVLPTDTEPGVEKRRCIRCGTVEERDIDPNGHDMTFVDAVAATCTAAGNNAYYLCANCGGYFADENGETALDFDTEVYIAALGHNVGDEPVETVPATCAAEGYNVYECSRCHNTVIETLPKISEHGATIPYGENIAATCAAPGQLAGTMCSLCGEVLTRPVAIPKLNHIPEQTRRDVTSASCTAAGYTGDLYCSVCGLKIESGTVEEATGHHLGQLLQVSAATCTDYGVKVRKCADCDYEETVETPVLGHQVVNDKAVAATCIADGLTAGKHCSRCGAVIEAQETIPAKGHSYTTRVVAPTCTTVGYTQYTCANGCGSTYRDNYTEKVDHVVGTPATCTDPAKCANCGRSFGTTIDHNYELISNTDSTCTVHGVRTYKCSMCGDTYTETKDLIDHRLTVDGSYGVEPTCTERGYSAMKCEMCGEYIITYDDAPLGHDYVDGVCTRCGEADPNYVPGTAPTSSDKCEKCGLNHNGRTGLWKQDGLFCRIIGFFRNLFKMFK